MMNSKKILLIRHTDLDGFAAGAAVVNSNLVKEMTKNDNPREDITDIAYSYNMTKQMKDTIKQHVKDERFIFIVDISISKANESDLSDIIEYAKKNKNTVAWFDHHASSAEWIENDPNGKEFAKNTINRIDISRSGAYITYQEMFDIYEDNEMPDVIRYVDDHDRFIHSMDESICLNDATFTRKFCILKNPLSDEWKRLIEGDLDLLNEILVTGKNYHDFYSEETSGYYARNGFKFLLKLDIYEDPNESNMIHRCWDVYNTPAVDPRSRYLLVSALNRVGNSTMFGDDYERSDACLTFVMRPLFKYSAYSSKSYVHCDKFMSLLGGGGHRGAAGCPSTIFSVPDSIISFNPNLIIPDEFGGGYVEWILRIRVTERAASRLMGEEQTLAEKIIEKAVADSKFNIDTISEGNLPFDDYDVACDYLIDYILDYEDNDFKWVSAV